MIFMAFAAPQQPFALGDWHRVLFGEAPPVFLAEVALRTLVTYVGVVAAMRLLGTRVTGQFTLFEISITVTIAAAVGVPLQASDRGLLPAFLLVIVLIGLQRLVVELLVRHRRIENMVETDVSTLVRDGSLLLDHMRRTAMSREQVFAVLRLRGYQQLGQAARLYMEASGRFSCIRREPPEPGLSLLPRTDPDLLAEARAEDWHACAHCGRAGQGAPPQRPCPQCGAMNWGPAARELDQ